MTSVFALATPAAAHLEPNPYTGNDDADHHHPDCEEGQPGIGASQPDSSQGLFAEGQVPGVRGCEGENWDNDDHASDQGPNEVDTDSSDGDVGASVNDGQGDDAPATETEPVRLRVTSGEAGANREAYTEVYVFSVGSSSVAADTDDDGTTRVAWYGEDHTPGNVLATAVSEAGLTRGAPGDGDCDFQTYELGRPNPDNPACTRDNTAITVELSP